MTTKTGRVAFFDVDETLITGKSMFTFLRLHFELCGKPPAWYFAIADHLAAMAEAGASRADTNREYYRAFSGQPVRKIAEHGKRWFERSLSIPGFFHPPAVSALHRHRAAGDQTVLVSGSFSACLDPIAEALGADAVLCSEPIAADGIYTGEVAKTMIGDAKGIAAAEYARAHGIAPADCAAYGDHASDLALLSAVGHPPVVGADPVLAALATDLGWPRLPGIGSAAPVGAGARG